MTPLVSSTKNAHVHDAARLKKRALREKDRKFLVEGRQGVAEALVARRVEILFHADGQHHDVAEAAQSLGARVVRASEDVLKHLTSTVTPQGLVAVASFLDVPLEAVREPNLVAVLCAVRDPGNAGTILRSADAAGADGVVFAGESVDVYNSKTVRASAGSIFHLPVVREVGEGEAVEALRARGVQVLAADANGQASLDEVDLTKRTALLFGNEAWGLPEATAALADRTVRIPMRGRAESLNLAAAATLMLFEASRSGARPAISPPAGGAEGGGDLARWVSGSAHDLRSPLTGLTGFTSMLAKRWDRLSEEQRQELVASIRVDADRVGANIKRVIDAARAELGTLSPQAETLDVRDLVAKAAAALQAREIELETDVPGGALTITGDPERLFLAVLALAEAAAWWQFGAGAPRLRAEAADDGAVRVIAERDAEPGSAPGDWPFVPDGEGRGLGVALLAARGVIERHGGSLEHELSASGLRIAARLPASPVGD